MTLFWPIAFILFVVAVFFGISRLSGNGVFASMYGNRTRWMLIMYATVLLVATVVFYFLPQNNFAYEQLDGEEVERLETIHQEFYDAAFAGRLDEMEDVFVDGQWTFPFTGDELSIQTYGNNHLGGSLFVERTTDTETIDVVYYTTKTVMNSIDFSDQVPAPDVQMSDVQLNIIMPEPVRVKFSTVEPEFTIRQFNEEQESIFSHSHSYWANFGVNALYLRIPDHVNVQEDPNIHIQYVEN